MKFKPVFTYDKASKKVRLFRWLWQRNGQWSASPPADKTTQWYSAKLSVSLAPKLAAFERSMFGWRFTLLGVQIHHLKAYGGVIV